MKTLGKLKIDTKKILKNEDLKNLNGGMGCCFCDGYGYMLGATIYNCHELCAAASNNWSYGLWECAI